MVVGVAVIAAVAGCGGSSSSRETPSGSASPSDSSPELGPVTLRCYNSAQWASDGNEQVTASDPAEAASGFEAAVSTDTDFRWEADRSEEPSANDSAEVVFDPSVARMSIDNSFSGRAYEYSLTWSEQPDGYEFDVESTTDSAIEDVQSLRVSLASDPSTSGPLGALALISRSGPLEVADDPEGTGLSVEVGVQRFTVGSRSGEVIAWESPSRPGTGQIITCLEQ